LDDLTRKKFSRLSVLGRLFVVGYSTCSQARRFSDGAVQFYALPLWRRAVLRQTVHFLGGLALLLWLILRHRVHAIVAQGPYEGFVAALAKRLARLFGRTVGLVIETHGDFEEWLFAGRRLRGERVFRGIMTRAARFSLRRADVLRSISRFTTEQLRQYAATQEIIQFPAWTDIELFLRQGNRRPAQDSRTVLFAGALLPLKGVHHLIAAFAQAVARDGKLRLVLIGEAADRAYVEGLKRQAEELRVADRVRFVPPVPQAELARWMAESRAFVLPSLSEGLGRVALEAMAAGTPVIASRVGGIVDLIRHGETGYLVGPGDEAGLAEEIVRVAAWGEEVAAVCRRARELATSLFSTEAYVGAYRRLLEACPGEP
jgi:glycosyltransferase involved in cell wall biosynthesis